jgi:tetratricopeptide (TPR) repeat protein
MKTTIKILATSVAIIASGLAVSQQQNVMPMAASPYAYGPGYSSGTGFYGGNTGKATTNKSDGAREAFARGDIDGAVALYQKRIKRNSKDVEAHQELGNVYYSTGRLPQAAQAYTEAVSLMIEKKEFDDVDPMLSVIAEFNPGKADELIRKLHNAMDEQMKVSHPRPSYEPLQKPSQSALTRY